MNATKTLHGLIFSLLVLGAASGATWYVDAGNTTPPYLGTQADPFDEITDGITAALNGDTVLVMPGTYTENIDFSGKAITVKSNDGPLTTIIDGGTSPWPGFESAVYFQSGEGNDSIIDGFTITNGKGTDMGGFFLGGGIFVLGAAPTIINNFIIDNSVGNTTNMAGFGGGLSFNFYHPSETPLVQNNFIMNNWSADDGAGISIGILDSAGVNIINNLIVENETDDQWGESGGGIDVFHGYAYIGSCTICDNIASSGRGGGIRVCDWGMADIYDSIIWGNIASMDPQINAVSGTMAYYSDIQDASYPADPWFGPGCIAANPLFVTGPLLAYNDYYLSQVAAGQALNSPCVDAGDPLSPMITGTTRTDKVQDNGILDLGFHYPISSVPPDEYHVPDDYTTIQGAINAVPAESTIIVRPGTYYENIDFNGKNVTVVSEKGPHVTIIDGDQADKVVKFMNDEGLDSVLDGFTVTNGYTTGVGAGIYCYMTAPTIVNNIVTLNTSTGAYGGGGIYCFYRDPLIKDNVITENHSDESGGGIRLEYCEAVVTGCYIARNTTRDGGGLVSDGFDGLIENCVVVDNTATRGGGGYNCAYDSDATIVNCVFAGNTAQNSWGGGLYFSYGSNATVVNCTVADNTSTGGGGIVCYSAAPTVVNSILWDNDAPTGPEISLLSSSTLTIDYSDVEGGQAGANVDGTSTLNWGANNMIVMPLFYDAPNRDYHLKWASSCRDAGDNNAAGLPDEDFESDPRIALGTVDLGADEFYYHLYHLGPVVPGQTLTLRFVGGPGMPTTLYLGASVLDPPMSTNWGDFYLPWPTLWQGSMGNIPASGIRSVNVTVPTTWAPGDWHPTQALIGNFSDPLAHLTNLMILGVE